MGFDHLIQGSKVGWVVFITLSVMSVMSWYWIIINFIKNMLFAWPRRSRGQHVLGNLERAGRDSLHGRTAEIRAVLQDRAGCGPASLHHQRHDGSRLAESLNRSEFVDRALRQAVTRESLGLEDGLTVLATVGSAAPFVGLLGTVWGIYHALIKIGSPGDARSRQWPVRWVKR